MNEKQATHHATPRSADRLLAILEMLAEDERGCTLAALSKRMGTPKSSVLNLMRALTQAGYVDHVEGVYRLGGRAFRLASAIVARRRFPEAALPILRRLAETTSETAMICEMAPGGDEFVYIAKAESTQALRFAATVGDRRPLYATAGGLVLLAYLPKRFVDDYLSRTTFSKLTPYTKTKRADIETMLQEVRERGYALTTAGSTLGLTGIAAPIFGTGGLVGGVVLGIPTERYQLHSQELIAETCAAARDISEVLGQISQTQSV
ncbi:IclR family transcriptional regulator [Aquamicrobium sp. LC103]|uniref:IclR family transcriptional regulator n=1 Tax=Aquamicrobium sp. LC103 TaxID=1120658 RepID=UPI000699FAF1|nr:IclR family transcriptional regulator [Aquamicrobium sp. LC103]TKT74790.1 IclR family transcriptional regulator [Aquamicrobium sp. LC103]